MGTETPSGCSSKTGACALGAGVAAITCKGMFLGFLGGILAIVGLSGVSQAALTAAVLVGGAVLVYYGFGWAGRRPVLFGFAGLATMWIGYSVAGGLYYGNWIGAEFGGDVILENPEYLIPVGLIYIVGTALFAYAAWDSFGKEMKDRESIGPKSAMGVGVAGASVCGGCGVTGLVGGLGVVALGTAGVKRDAAYVAMLLAALVVLGYTVYRRQWKQSGVVAVGSIVAIPLPRFVLPPYVPSGEFASVILMGVTYIGLAIVFFGLVWAYYPEMQVVPSDWRLPSGKGDTA